MDDVLSPGAIDPRKYHDTVPSSIANLALPQDIEAQLVAIDVSKALLFIREGSFLLKYARLKFKKPHARLFHVDMDSLFLSWVSPNKADFQSRVPLHKIDKIIPGLRSRYWKADDPARALGIELKLIPRSHLRLVCTNPNEWRLWVRGLTYVHEKASLKIRKEMLTTSDDDLYRHMWMVADVNDSGSVQWDELVSMFVALDIHADMRFVRNLFDTYDEDGSQVLEYNAFRELVSKIAVAPELNAMATRFRPEGQKGLNADGVKGFWEFFMYAPAEEGEKEWKFAEALPAPFFMNGFLTDAGLRRMVMHPRNGLANPDWNALSAEVSATFPEYWIYGCDDPFQNDMKMTDSLAAAMAEGYRFLALRITAHPKDGRAVVVACPSAWNAKPRYLPLHLALKTIRNWAFVTTPMPLLLNIIFSHQAAAQEIAETGKLIRADLEEMLFTTLGPLPQVHDLKKKVLICGPHLAVNKVRESGYEEDMALRDHETEGTLPELTEVFKRPPSQTGSVDFVPSFAPEDKEKLDTFNQIVSLEIRPLAKDPSPMTAHAIALSKVKNLHEKHRGSLTLLHVTKLGITFVDGPKAAQACQNFVDALLMGFSCIGLPMHQGSDGYLVRYVQRGLFMMNGRCGYILKPPILRLPNMALNIAALPDEVESKVLIRFISVHQLPRPVRCLDERVAVIISVKGVPNDNMSHSLMTHQGVSKFRDNEMTFDITIPAAAFLIFEARNSEGTLLAASCMYLPSLRQGLRWVELHDVACRAIPWCGMLVELRIKPRRTKPASPPLAMSPSNLRTQDLKVSGALSQTPLLSRRPNPKSHPLKSSPKAKPKKPV